MRAIAILLLCTCLAGSAGAEPSAFQRAMATPDANAPKNGSTAAAMPTMIGGKFVVGYEGRGDYLKNEELEKQLANNPSRAVAPSQLAEDIALGEKSKPAGAKDDTATTKPAAPAEKETVSAAAKTNALRSDSALRSDASKPQAVAEAAPPPQAPASSPAPVPGAPNYNPMMLISNGQVIQQH